MGGEYSRRDFMKAAGSAALAASGAAGCLGRREPKYVPGTPRTFKFIEEYGGPLKIDEGDWWNYEFDFPHGGKINYDVRVVKGPRLETMVLPYDRYKDYVDKEIIDFSDGGDPYDLNRYSSTRLSDVGELPEGDFIFIIDNTRRGITNPPADSWFASPEEKNDEAYVTGRLSLTPRVKK